MNFSRFYTFKELCIGFGISANTMKKYIAPVKKKLSKTKGERKRLYSEEDVTIIKNHLTSISVT